MATASAVGASAVPPAASRVTRESGRKRDQSRSKASISAVTAARVAASRGAAVSMRHTVPIAANSQRSRGRSTADLAGGDPAPPPPPRQPPRPPTRPPPRPPPVGPRRASRGRFGLDGVDGLVEAAAGQRRAGDARDRDVVDVLADDLRGDAPDELALILLGLPLGGVSGDLDRRDDVVLEGDGDGDRLDRLGGRVGRRRCRCRRRRRRRRPRPQSRCSARPPTRSRRAWPPRRSGSMRSLRRRRRRRSRRGR